MYINLAWLVNKLSTKKTGQKRQDTISMFLTSLLRLILLQFLLIIVLSDEFMYIFDAGYVRSIMLFVSRLQHTQHSTLKTALCTQLEFLITD